MPPKRKNRLPNSRRRASSFDSRNEERACEKLPVAGGRRGGAAVAGRLVGVQHRAGRDGGACQRRSLLLDVRRAPGLGLLRPSADDGPAGVAGAARLARNRIGRALLLHTAAAPLPLPIVAADTACRCGAARRRTFRDAFGRDADVAALRIHRGARRSADDDRDAVSAGARTVRRTAPRGLALAGAGYGGHGLQQVSRGIGGAFCAGSQSAAAAPFGALCGRGGGAVAACAPFPVAIPPRLGFVRLPPFGAQCAVPAELRDRFRGQHAGGFQSAVSAALHQGVR